MKLKSRTSSLLVLGVVSLLSPLALNVTAHTSTSSPRPEPVEGQDQAPNRREITLTARNYLFTPNRIEVAQDDLVNVTVQSEDVAYSVTIDEYRVSRRVPAGTTTRCTPTTEPDASSSTSGNLFWEGGFRSPPTEPTAVVAQLVRALGC